MTAATSPPDAAGRSTPPTRLPAEWEPHERTVMGWPTRVRVAQLWREQLDAAREVHALVAAAVARYEPVTMLVDEADPGAADEARRRCGEDVEVVEVPLDDSWLRDTGPLTVRDAAGTRLGVHFGFNGWGGTFTPHERDREVGRRVLDHLGIGRIDATDLVLEGGSVAVDGAGLLVTTRRCLLNPNRNPDLGRPGIEARLRHHLGVERIVWCDDGIAEDEGTDGHVDNVVAFVAAGRVILQGCGDAGNPNHANAADNRAVLEAAGVEVVELADLPYATVAGVEVPVPYANFYVCNGAVVVPTVGGGEARWLDRIGDEFPQRDVVAVPGEVLAYGGGGVHCITQQVIRP